MPVFLLFLICVLFFLPLKAFAGPQSSTYELRSYGFGTGATDNNTSTTYSLFGTAGEITASHSSTTYTEGAGLVYTIGTNTPSSPTFTNPSSYYNKLFLQINTSSNPTDTKYAIAVSNDNFVNNVLYVQADDTLDSSSVWQTNTVWGSSGFTIIGLTPGTTYYAKVSALQGNFTQSPFSAVASAATINPTFSYSLSTNSVTFPQLVPGTVQTSTTTVTISVSTNAVTGATIFASDTNSGLASGSTSYTISAVSNNLSTAGEGYGLRSTAVTQTSGGPMEKLSPYNGAGNNVGLLNTNQKQIFDSTNAAVTNGQGTFELQAKAGATAKAAADYGDTITVTAAGQF